MSTSLMVVAGLDTYNHRAEESVKFMQWGFQAWGARQLYTKGTKLGTVKVSGGSSRKIDVIAPQDIYVTLPAGTNENVQTKVVDLPNLHAPIMAGDHVADIVSTTQDTPPQTVALVAATDDPEASFFARIWNAILSLFGL